MERAVLRSKKKRRDCRLCKKCSIGNNKISDKVNTQLYYNGTRR